MRARNRCAFSVRYYVLSRRAAARSGVGAQTRDNRKRSYVAGPRETPRAHHAAFLARRGPAPPSKGFLARPLCAHRSLLGQPTPSLSPVAIPRKGAPVAVRLFHVPFSLSSRNNHVAVNHRPRPSPANIGTANSLIFPQPTPAFKTTKCQNGISVETSYTSSFL